MGKGSYLGGSTLIGPGANWFSKRLSVEDRARQAAEDKARALQERIRVEQEAAQSELEKLLEQQAKALSDRDARSTPEAIEKRRLLKVERARLREENKATRRVEALRSSYPDLATDIDALFGKPE